jgi:hypothetical protein
VSRVSGAGDSEEYAGASIGFLSINVNKGDGTSAAELVLLSQSQLALSSTSAALAESTGDDGPLTAAIFAAVAPALEVILEGL